MLPDLRFCTQHLLHQTLQREHHFIFKTLLGKRLAKGVVDANSMTTIHGAIPENFIYIPEKIKLEVEYLSKEAQKFNLKGKVRKNGLIRKFKKK